MTTLRDQGCVHIRPHHSQSKTDCCKPAVIKSNPVILVDIFRVFRPMLDRQGVFVSYLYMTDKYCTGRNNSIRVRMIYVKDKKGVKHLVVYIFF